MSNTPINPRGNEPKAAVQSTAQPTCEESKLPFVAPQLVKHGSATKVTKFYWSITP